MAHIKWDMHTHKHTHTHIHTHSHTITHTHTQTHPHKHTHTHTHSHTHTVLHALRIVSPVLLARTILHALTRTHTRIHIQTYTRTNWLFSLSPTQGCSQTQLHASDTFTVIKLPNPPVWESQKGIHARTESIARNRDRTQGGITIVDWRGGGVDEGRNNRLRCCLGQCRHLRCCFYQYRCQCCTDNDNDKNNEHWQLYWQKQLPLSMLRWCAFENITIIRRVAKLARLVWIPILSAEPGSANTHTHIALQEVKDDYQHGQMQYTFVVSECSLKVF